MGQQGRPTEILIRPSNASTGAKRLLAQLTPLRLRSNGRTVVTAGGGSLWSSEGDGGGGKERRSIRLSTPALPRVPLLQPGHRNGAKSGLTANRRRVLTVAHMGQQGRPTEIPIRPSNASAGAKWLLTQLTPLRLRSNGRTVVTAGGGGLWSSEGDSG